MMIFYLSIISFSSIISILYNLFFKYPFIRITVYVLSALILVLPLSLRGMGVDYSNYTLMYDKVSLFSWNEYWDDYPGTPEPLYVLLNYIAFWIFDDYQGVNILCACISIFFSYMGMYKFRDYINIGVSVWSFCFIIYLMMYGLNRMMIAVSIIMYAYDYFLNGNIKKMIKWSLIAGGFHYSALLIIPFSYLLKKMRGSESFINLRRIKAFTGIIIIFISIYTIVPIIFSSLPMFARYQMYFNFSFEPAALNNNWMTYPAILMVCFFSKYYYRNFDQYNSILNAIFIFVILAILSTIMPVHRLCYYFYPAVILIYGAFSRMVKANDMIILTAYFSILLFIGILSIYVYTVYNQLWAPFITPYQMGNF